MGDHANVRPCSGSFEREGSHRWTMCTRKGSHGASLWLPCPDRAVDDATGPKPVGVCHQQRGAGHGLGRAGGGGAVRVPGSGAFAARALVTEFAEGLTGVAAALGEAFVGVGLVVVRQGASPGDLDQKCVGVRGLGVSADGAVVQFEVPSEVQFEVPSDAAEGSALGGEFMDSAVSSRRISVRRSGGAGRGRRVFRPMVRREPPPQAGRPLRGRHGCRSMAGECLLGGSGEAAHARGGCRCGNWVAIVHQVDRGCVAQEYINLLRAAAPPSPLDGWCPKGTGCRCWLLGWLDGPSIWARPSRL